MDGARQWVERYAAANPALAEALADGKLMERARQVTRLWGKAHDLCVDGLRRSDGIAAHVNRSQVHRASTSIVRAFITKVCVVANHTAARLGSTAQQHTPAGTHAWR